MKGQVKFKMRFDNQDVEVAAIIVTDLGPAILLGMDFLYKSRSSIDLNEMTLNLQGMRKNCCGLHAQEYKSVVGYCDIGTIARSQGEPSSADWK